MVFTLNLDKVLLKKAKEAKKKKQDLVPSEKMDRGTTYSECQKTTVSLRDNLAV